MKSDFNSPEYENTLPEVDGDINFAHKPKAYVSSLGPHRGDLEKKKAELLLQRENRLRGTVQAVPVLVNPRPVLVGFSVVCAILIGVGFVYGAGNGGKIAYNYVAQKNGWPQITSDSKNYLQQIQLNASGKLITEGLGSDDAVANEDIPVITDNTHFQLIDPQKRVQTFSPAYLVGDIETGEVVFAKNSTSTHPLASVTKLMTAVVAKENIKSQHEAVVNKEAYATFGSEGELKLNEKIKVADLMYPLLIESSNKGAEVLAYDYGREAFLTLMNEKAKALGMLKTHYDDASGLDADNVSTPTDLFILAQYIKRHYPELYDITRVREYTILTHAWKNQNLFLLRKDFMGGKNGYIDEAKKTTVSLFEIEIPVYARLSDEESSTTASGLTTTLVANQGAFVKTGKTIKKTYAVIILKSDDRNQDAAALINYVKQNVIYIDN